MKRRAIVGIVIGFAIMYCTAPAKAFSPGRTTSDVTLTGAIAAPDLSDGKATVMFPRENDAKPGTTVTLESSGEDAWPDNHRPPVLRGVRVIEVVSLTLSKDVTFGGFPSFSFTLPKTADSPAPYFVTLVDPATNTALATYTALVGNVLYFSGGFHTPFRIRSDHTYEAFLAAESPLLKSVPLVNVASVTAMSPLDGITATLELPPSTSEDIDQRHPGMNILASTTPPIGVTTPVLAAGKTLYYLSLDVGGHAAYQGMLQLDLRLPDRFQRTTDSYRLLFYDGLSFPNSGRWDETFFSAPITTRDTLRFTTPLRTILTWRKYAIALIAVPPHHFGPVLRKVPEEMALRPRIAVVGDSRAHLVLVPPSIVGCTSPGFQPTANCTYDMDPSLTYPGVLARLAGVPIANYSTTGALTTLDSYTGPSILDFQIPQIESDTSVVIFDAGVNDLILDYQGPSSFDRVAVITGAIRRRAPRTRILYVGARCWAVPCDHALIDGWNDAERRSASRYGAFVDTELISDEGASIGFPDGGHPSVEAARIVAARVYDVIRPWLRK